MRAKDNKTVIQYKHKAQPLQTKDNITMSKPIGHIRYCAQQLYLTGYLNENQYKEISKNIAIEEFKQEQAEQEAKTAANPE